MTVNLVESMHCENIRALQFGEEHVGVAPCTYQQAQHSPLVPLVYRGITAQILNYCYNIFVYLTESR